MSKKSEKEIIKEVTESSYKYGFVSKIESDTIPKGLSRGVVETISKKKGEPAWMLERRLRALELLTKMKQPSWAKLKINKI